MADAKRAIGSSSHARLLRLAAAVCAFSVWSLSAAQDYPSKPIRLIVPYAAGGSADFMARTVGARLAASLKQPVIVENRVGGAAGDIGTEHVVKSAPDGYTLLGMPTGPLTISGHFKKMPYDPLTDLVAIGMLGGIPSAIAVHSSLPVRSLQDFIKYAKERPAGVHYSVSGVGGNYHLAGELFKLMAGVPIIPVPYKGAKPAATALLTGEVPSSISDLVSLLPLANAGKIRILAMLEPVRSASAPDIPIVAEAGVPGYSAAASAGLFAPAETPRSIVTQLSTALLSALRLPELRKAYLAAGVEPILYSPEETARFMKEDTEKWGKVIHDANIKIAN